jgi:hypothetical protein
VGEVDQLQDPVDERVAERDERVDRALREADQEDGEEVLRAGDEVVRQPRQEQRDEREADQRQDGGPLPPPRDPAPGGLLRRLSFYRDPRDSRRQREGV